jgi:hypothetical protein
MESLLEVLCAVDDFCQTYHPAFAQVQLRLTGQDAATGQVKCG